MGEKSPVWKGSKAGKQAIHDWVKQYKGKPNKCEICGTLSAKKYEWANIDHKYSRKLEHYIRLCTSCHRIFDNEKIKIIDGNCIVCGKKFKTISKKKMYCSWKCWSIKNRYKYHKATKKYE